MTPDEQVESAMSSKKEEESNSHRTAFMVKDDNSGYEELTPTKKVSSLVVALIPCKRPPHS